MSAEPVLPPSPEVTSARTQSHPLGLPKAAAGLRQLCSRPAEGAQPRKQWGKLRPGPCSPAAWKPLPQELAEQNHLKPQEVSLLLSSQGSSVPSLGVPPVPAYHPHTYLVQAAGRKLNSHGKSRLYSVPPREVTPSQCVPIMLSTRGRV